MRLPKNISEAQRDQHVRFVMRFQQCTGPVMAKGLEDTALYLYHRLIALNEVGGNPEKIWNYNIRIPSTEHREILALPASDANHIHTRHEAK
jgi:(1->4)-alpha-D-glucan 1-alpha-D-glucosylmutase